MAQTSGCSEDVLVLVFGGCVFVVLVLGFFNLSFCGLLMKQFNRESGLQKSLSSADVFWWRV